MRTGAVGVAVCLAAALLPLQGWWITGGTALVTVFLAVGYVFTKRVAVAVPLAYSVLDALGFAMMQSASVGGSIIRGAIDALNDTTKDDAIGSSAAAPVEITLPQYSLIVFAATLVLNLLMLGPWWRLARRSAVRSKPMPVLLAPNGYSDVSPASRSWPI